MQVIGVVNNGTNPIRGYFPSFPSGYTVRSRGCPDMVLSLYSINLETTNLTSLQVEPVTYTKGPTSAEGDTLYSFTWSPPVSIKRVLDRVGSPQDQGKHGFKGQVNKDAIEQMLNSNSRYMTNSNIFTQTFLGR